VFGVRCVHCHVVQTVTGLGTSNTRRLNIYLEGDKNVSNLKTKLMLLTGVGVIALMPPVKADESNQKTLITFSGPVEVPGQILPAGTYVFKLANSTSSRNIVQIYNQKENRVFGTFLAIPDYRMRPADNTIIRFEERPAGSPPAIKAWFYPGRQYGNEFVYPKTRAVTLANVNHTPVPSMPADLMEDTTKANVKMNGPEITALMVAPLKAEEPDGEEVEVADAFAVTDTQAPGATAGLPARLPSTASSLPLIGILGLLSLSTAAVLRLAGAKAK
jgi:hypothetical protein